MLSKLPLVSIVISSFTSIFVPPNVRSPVAVIVKSGAAGRVAIVDALTLAPSIVAAVNLPVDATLIVVALIVVLVKVGIVTRSVATSVEIKFNV